MNHDYDINEILFYLNKQNIKPFIPSKHNRVYQRDYEQELYCFCHIMENIFLILKYWCAIVTCYTKALDAFIASVLFIVSLCYFYFLFSFISYYADAV